MGKNAWTQVRVNNENLEHHGQAGVVQAPGDKPNTSLVKLDAVDEPLVFADADLVDLV
jgi:hypothetical protein